MGETPYFFGPFAGNLLVLKEQTKDRSIKTKVRISVLQTAP